MSDPKHVKETSDLKYSRSRKAWNAAIAASGLALGGVSVTGLFTAHGLNGEAIGVAAGVVVTSFVGTFITAFLSSNEGQ